MKQIYTGAWYRVQLTITKWSKCAVKKWRNDPTTYTLWALSNGMHKSTAYSKGKLVYHGIEARDAVIQAKKWGVEVPINDP